MDHLTYLLPSDIRFTQDNINSVFFGGDSVNKTIEKICYGKMRVEELPLMTVIKLNNSFYSYDNRRLYVFRVLELLNGVQKIPVFLTTYIDTNKFTSQNNGESIVVRNDVTFPQAMPKALPADKGQIKENKGDANTTQEPTVSAIATKTNEIFLKGQILSRKLIKGYGLKMLVSCSVKKWKIRNNTLATLFDPICVYMAGPNYILMMGHGRVLYIRRVHANSEKTSQVQFKIMEPLAVACSPLK
uniref:uncharacterized protein LOC100180450 n=1 Tax=Ciona intestinalis TaxID=7719 RepID=UPI00052133F9|nr:uncharacterized protein LOC100180450 [Ciona intestinalis]|eukprot:XP_002130515.2 uncharacterized protein LOC100180450 [Ciona intestinalis]